jgi:3-dehydroquinate synthase
MKTIVLHAKDRNYNIYCGKDIYTQAGELFGISSGKVCIITDTNVAPLYMDNLKKSLKCDVCEFVFPAGEASKTVQTCLKAYDFLALRGFSRTDSLIALGGGVCGDLTGFIASTYLRGIKYYSVATTLLAQVDSSIGGKCGVDIERGKNLVGAFYQPFGVIADTGTLATLPKDVFCDGSAEVIKYGLIYDREIYNKCSEDIHKNIDGIIYRCIDIKREIVEKDEFDCGLRMILNFGHTIGHAIERLGNYTRYTHGQAVAMGMAYAARLSEATGTAKRGLYDKIAAILKKLSLPVNCDYTPEELAPALLSDKKIRDGSLNFILLSDIGKAVIYKVNERDVLSFIKKA